LKGNIIHDIIYVEEMAGGLVLLKLEIKPDGTIVFYGNGYAKDYGAFGLLITTLKDKVWFMSLWKEGVPMQLKDLIGEATEYDKKKMLEERKPKSWCKSVSAFANGIGGTLIFGISDDEQIVGLQNAKRDSETISEQIKTRLDPIPQTRLSLYKTEDGKELIVLEVSSGYETPYYYIGEGNRTAYYRIGNESVPVDAIKLKELVLRGSDSSYDSLVSKYKFEEFSFTKLKSVYKQRTGKVLEDSDFESFGIVNEEGKLTNAGALLADESPIRQSRLFCTRWNGLDKASGVVDALDDKEFSGSLISLLQNGAEFVKNNSKMKWKKVSDGRIELPDYPERSVLEGMVNGLIHRQYLELGSEVHIDIFDDRLEIYSPGGMYDGSVVQERDISRIPSKRRNPIIADIFNRLKYMERRGSGFRKIRDDYREQYLYTDAMEPEFYSDRNSFILTLKNLNYVKISFKKSNKKTAIKNGDKTISAKTQKKYEKILGFMEREKEYKTAEIAELLELQKSHTRKLLNELVDLNKIEAIGNNKSRVYMRI